MNDDQQQLAIDFHAPATIPPADAFALRKARYEEACALHDWALEQALAALDTDGPIPGFVPALFDDFMRRLDAFKASAWREFHGQPTHHFTIEPDSPRAPLPHRQGDVPQPPGVGRAHRRRQRRRQRGELERGGAGAGGARPRRGPRAAGGLVRLVSYAEDGSSLLVGPRSGAHPGLSPEGSRKFVGAVLVASAPAS